MLACTSFNRKFIFPGSVHFSWNVLHKWKGTFLLGGEKPRSKHRATLLERFGGKFSFILRLSDKHWHSSISEFTLVIKLLHFVLCAVAFLYDG